LRDGILTSMTRGSYKAVWLHEPDKAHWAAMHTIERNGGRIEDVIVIEVRVPKDWLRRHGGKAKGLWRCVRNVRVRFIRRVVGFEVLSRLPVGKAVGR
jgi:hypothetical protein